MLSHAQKGRTDKKRIAFVPTMGALHSGHQALMREAARHGEIRVVSIFVNPTQFNNPTDFEKYPRTLEEDLKICAQEGIDYLFTPSVKEIYPKGLKVENSLPKVAKVLEGEFRPGHFAGVCTVVGRLFDAVQPDVALFGEKDYQQWLVIREWAKQKKNPVKILSCPTVRDQNGLALSSRNRRLSPKGLNRALAIPEAIRKAQQLFKKGERKTEKLVHVAKEHLGSIPVDYVMVADDERLQTLEIIDRPSRIFITARIEGVRLIDNASLDG